MPVPAVKIDHIGPTVHPDPIPVPLTMKNGMFLERRRTMRRGNVEQGRALEMLGHAVEYLVDSRLFGVNEQAVKDNQEAVQILMRLSRTVFCECPVVVPRSHRISGWARNVGRKVFG